MGFFDMLFKRIRGRHKKDPVDNLSALHNSAPDSVAIEDFLIDMFRDDTRVTGIQIICRGIGRSMVQRGGTKDAVLEMVNEAELKALLLAFLDAEESNMNTNINLDYFYNYVKNIRRQGYAVDQEAFRNMFKKWDNAEQPM